MATRSRRRGACRVLDINISIHQLQTRLPWQQCYVVYVHTESKHVILYSHHKQGNRKPYTTAGCTKFASCSWKAANRKATETSTTVDLVNFTVTLFSLYSWIENISENYILEKIYAHIIMRSQYQATALLWL